MNTKETIANISNLVEEKQKYINDITAAKNSKICKYEQAIGEAVEQLRGLLQLDKHFSYIGDDIENFYRYGNVGYELCLRLNDFDYVSLAIYLEREDDRIIFGLITDMMMVQVLNLMSTLLHLKIYVMTFKFLKTL